MLLHQMLKATLQEMPDKPAIIVDDDVCTYRGLDEISQKWAQAMLHLGINRGDRVTILMPNRVEYLQLYYACYRIGAVACPMSSVYQTLSDEVAWAANLTKSKLLIVSAEHYPEAKELKGRVPSLERIFVIDDMDDDELSWPRYANAALHEIPWPEVMESDPALILFTSGSTDRPKGVTHTHHSLLYNTINKSTTVELDHEDIYLIGTMLCHASGSFGFSLPTLYKGGTVIFMGAYNADGFLDLIERYRPTHVVSVPVHVREIVSLERSKQIDFGSIKTFRCGGDIVTHELFEAFYQLTGFELNQSYGCTECEEFCMNPPYGKKKRGAIGVPVHGTRMRLIDLRGRDVPQGETGEILVRNEAMMAGYWDDPVNTEKAFIDGWLRTGDLAYQDDEGYYYFIGRTKNIIVKDGANIAPAEIEDVINEHPRVKVCGVVGTPDPHHGQIVHAFIVPRTDMGESCPTQEELSAFTGKRLSIFKVPDRWTFMESLPLTSIWKIDRKALADLAKEISDQPGPRNRS